MSESTAALLLEAPPLDTAMSDLAAATLRLVGMPSGAAANEQLHGLLADLGRRDGFAAARRLERPAERMKEPLHQRPFYAVALVIAEAWAAAGQPLDGHEHLMHTIREQVRLELVGSPLVSSPRWVIPATFADRTAAYVAALHLASLDGVSRPWLWEPAPAMHRFVIVGTPPIRHHLVDHPRCEGAHSLLELIARRPKPWPVRRPAQAVARAPGA